MTHINSLAMCNFLSESYRIEGIMMAPQEIPAHHVNAALNFCMVPPELDNLEACLIEWVRMIQKDAIFRSDRTAPNVTVGQHMAPLSGPEVKHGFTQIVDAAMLDKAHPYDVHTRYQNLHPFTDGNGRSGRLLTFRQMAWHHPQMYNNVCELGWLHAWYYLSLADADRRIERA